MNIKDLFAGVPNTNELPPGDLKARGEAVGNMLTIIVHYLRTLGPTEKVRLMANHAWNLIGSKTVSLVLYDEIPTPHVFGLDSDNEESCAIFMPPNWLEQLHSDPVMAVGSIIFVGSQAVDFYNGKLKNRENLEEVPEKALARAWSLEADYLLALEASPEADKQGWKPNQYQRKVLSRFPLGTQTPGTEELFYPYRVTPLPGGESADA